jgi:hypothetical protein
MSAATSVVLLRLASWPVFGLVFVITRVALIFAVARLTQGSELSDDVALHVGMMRAPLDGLLGSGVFALYPPLLPLIESAPFTLFESSLGSSVAIRCAYALFECLAAVLVHIAVRHLAGKQAAVRAAWLLLALPCGFLSSTVLPQDECVAYAFAAGALLALAFQRETTALVLLSIGVVAAKVFFIVPLFALVVWLRKAPFAARCVYAFAPCTLVYALLWSLHQRSGALRILRFAPSADFGVNAWVFAAGSMPATSVRSFSLVCGGALALACIARPLWTQETVLGARPVAAFTLASAALAWFFVGFYHVNPEYYALLLPAIVLSCRRAAHAVIALLATGLPWAVNIAHGIQHKLDKHDFAGAKGRIAAAYVRYVSVDIATLHALMVTGTTLATIALAMHLTRTAATSPES